MAGKFGVIASKTESGYIILAEGTDDELGGLLNVIRESPSVNTANIIYVDEDKYNNCKDNILELNTFIDSNIS
ncbi:MAG: hypothetical protein J6A59_09390 [Lachnospiraceae bacterium]|nr:hypothetical protein [Lachnospiraceae bacterium]